jgi:hypothetical protein
MHRPLTRWNHYRHTRRQTRTALRLLTLSGVIRPSTSEPRYIISPLKVTALRDHQECPVQIQPHVPSRPHQINLAITRLQATAKTWVEFSTHHLRQLHWGMGKAAWRIIGIPSVR